MECWIDQIGTDLRSWTESAGANSTFKSYMYPVNSISNNDPIYKGILLLPCSLWKMNSFIYERSAFKEKVDKIYFDSENLVASSIDKIARRSKNIFYSSFKRTRSQKYMGVIKKRNSGVSQILFRFWERRVSRQRVHVGCTGSTEERCMKGVN